MKRFLATLLACMMLAALVPSALAEQQELTTITIVSYDDFTTINGTQYWLHEITEGKLYSSTFAKLTEELAQRGIKINFDLVTQDQYSTYLRTNIAGGMSGDIYLIRDLDETTRVSMAADGYFLPLSALYPYSDGTIKHYLEEEEGAYNTAYQSLDGELYWLNEINLGYYKTRDMLVGNYQVSLIRQDWAEKLGVDIPSTPDELVDFVVACRENDVNGTGVADEMIHLGAEPNCNSAWFGTGDQWYYLNDDGKFTSPWYNDGWYDYLQLLKRINDVGGLELTSAKATLEKENKLIGTTNWVSRNATFTVPEDQPKPLYTPYVITPAEGEHPYIMLQSGVDVSKRAFAINAKTDKVEAIAKLFDWTLTRDFMELEKREEFHGISWVDEDEGEAPLTETAEYDFDNFAAMNKANYTMWKAAFPHGYTEFDRQESIESWADPNQAFMASEYGYGYPYTRMKTVTEAGIALCSIEESETIADCKTDLETYMSELAVKLVLGEKSFDDMDAYIKDMQKLGLDTLLEVYQNRYDRAQEALANMK